MAADPETFHHYQVLRRPDGSLHELGRGAMGVTYKAFDTNLRCPVALKVINATYLHSETARARFLREARAAAGLSHPNVAAAFHLGQDADSYFYAMEYVDGETLDGLVRRRGPLPAALALRITLQVARALRAAHRIGLVHRDIKPANLMVVREEDRDAEATLAAASARAILADVEDDDEDDIHVKVIDFGLAKSLIAGDSSQAASLTGGGFVGTPHYASPEQLEEKEIDTRSDIYSLGATLWFSLMGKPPFSGTLAQIISQHLSRDPVYENLEKAGVPAPAVTLLRRMLAKDPAGRPQSPTDLRREIEHALRALRAAAAPAMLAGAATVAPPPPSSQAVTVAPPPSVPVPTLLHDSQSAAVPPPSSQGPPSSRGESVVPLAPGAVVAGRYRLLREAGPEGGRGQLFQALDLQTERPVGLKVLPAVVTEDARLFDRVLAEVELARRPEVVNDPGLTAVHALERLPDRPQAIFVTGWVEGLSLLAVLRRRGALTVPETLGLIEGMAAAVDHAAAVGLRQPDLALGQILLALEGDDGAPPPETTTARAALLDAPLDRWPPHRPKVLPLTLPDMDAAAGASEEAVTWMGEHTMVGSRTPTGGAPARGSERLARLAVELLGGAAADAAPERFTPLPALAEQGNNVLRAALSPAGVSPYPDAGTFARALRAATVAAAPPVGAVLVDPPPLTVARTARARSLNVVSEVPVPTMPPPPTPRAAVPPPPPAVAPVSVTSRPPITVAAAPPPPPRFTPPPPPPAEEEDAPTYAPVTVTPWGASATPPPPPTPQLERPERQKSGLPMLALILLGILVLGLAGGGAAFLVFRGGDKGIAKDDPKRQPSPAPTATPRPVPTAQPVPIPTAQPVPIPTAEPVRPTPPPSTPPPPPTPAPSASPTDRYRVAAEAADALSRNGDYAGALNAFLQIAQDFPERDPGRTKLDGVIQSLRGAFPPETSIGARKFQEVRPLVERAARNGSDEATLYVGQVLGESDPGAARAFFEQAANERGQARALVGLGNLYFRGRGVARDESHGLQLYQQAANKGDALAKVYLGECYQNGWGGVRRDPAQALALYQEALAAEPNNPFVLDKLGVCYDKGIGTPVDPKKAFELTSRAAELGNGYAIGNLGTFYIRGVGVEKADPARAAELFQQGAERDNPPSMFYYAACLEDGIGLKKNAPEARRWYVASATRGFPLAVDWCKVHKVPVPAMGGR